MWTKFGTSSVISGRSIRVNIGYNIFEEGNSKDAKASKKEQHHETSSSQHQQKKNGRKKKQSSLNTHFLNSKIGLCIRQMQLYFPIQQESAGNISTILAPMKRSLEALFFYRGTAALPCFLEAEFINKYASCPRFYMCSDLAQTSIQRGDIIFEIQPGGNLNLYMDSSNFQRLGLQGKREKYGYSVSVNLRSKKFVSRKGYFKRVCECLDATRVGAASFLAVLLDPDEFRTCTIEFPSGVVASQENVGVEFEIIEPCKVPSLEMEHYRQTISLSDLNCDQWDQVESLLFQDFHTWLGAMACGIPDASGGGLDEDSLGLLDEVSGFRTPSHLQYHTEGCLVSIRVVGGLLPNLFLQWCIHEISVTWKEVQWLSCSLWLKNMKCQVSEENINSTFTLIALPKKNSATTVVTS